MLLRSTTPRAVRSRRLAFTLLEILIVVAIIVLLAGISVVALWPAFAKGEEGVARAKAEQVCKAAELYHSVHKQWPDNVAALVQADPDYDNKPYVTSDDDVKDPWGKYYEIDPSGPNHNGTKPDVYTMTPSNKKIGNWGR